MSKRYANRVPRQYAAREQYPMGLWAVGYYKGADHFYQFIVGIKTKEEAEEIVKKHNKQWGTNESSKY